MRKTELYIIGIVILIVAGFLIISNTLSGKIITMTGQTAKKIKNCSEDDFGNNKFLKGTVSQSIYGNAKAYTDYCKGKTNYTECGYYYANDNAGEYSKAIYLEKEGIEKIIVRADVYFDKLHNQLATFTLKNKCP